MGEHVWLIHESGYHHDDWDAGVSCMFCEGGLSACLVCGGFEGTLTTHCSGNSEDRFTLDRVYDHDLDFINGTWVKQPNLTTRRWRGKSVMEIRADWDWIQSLSSMEKAKVLRGW